MGKVFVWGGGLKPTIVSSLSSVNVIQVGADCRNQFFVLSDVGDVFTFNIHQVSNNNKVKFQKLQFELGVKEKIIMIAPVDSGLIVLTNVGKVLAHSQKNNEHQTRIVNIMGDQSKVVKISSAGHNCFILEMENGVKKVMDAQTGEIPSLPIFGNNVPFVTASAKTVFYVDSDDNSVLKQIDPQYSGTVTTIHKGSNNWLTGSARSHHSLFVSIDGYVYSLGKNFETLLCGETMLEDKELTKLSVLKNVENVYQCKDMLQIYGSNKHYFSLARTKTGQLFAWGGNHDAQLGISSDRKHAIFACLVNELYGMKIAQADCGSSVAIALSENFSNALSESLNKEELSDLKIEIFADNTSETREIYIHKCVLLARCPTLLNLLLSGKLNYFLRRLLMNSNDNNSNEEFIATGNARINCTSPIDPNNNLIENVHDSLMVLFHYLYIDDMGTLSMDLEKDTVTIRMVQTLVNFFYFLELNYFNNEPFVTYTMMNNCKIDHSLLKTFEEWNYSSKKFDNMSEHNRMVRTFALENVNSSVDLKFTEQRIGYHMVSIMGKEDTCEDYKLALQSKDGQLEVSMPLHKVILTNSIEFFKGVFESNMEEEKRGEMNLTMNSTEDFYLFQLENVIPLLFHAYCGNVHNFEFCPLFLDKFQMSLTESNACECLAVGNYFASRGFKALCESFISQFINIENVVPLLLVSETHEAYSLKEVAIDFSALHFEEVQLIQEFHNAVSEETREFVKRMARKRSKKILDNNTLEKFWRNEISENDLYNKQPTPTISSINSAPPPSTVSRERKPSIFSKLARFFK